MSFTIREPTLRDVPRLYKLIQKHAEFEEGVASLRIDQLEALILARSKPIRFFVAERDRVLIGYAAVTFDWSTWRARRYAHLDCLFVNRTQRGGGIGRSLLAEARAMASAEGADRLEWQTPAWNEGACRFYVREGATFQPKLRFNLVLPSIATSADEAA